MKRTCVQTQSVIRRHLADPDFSLHRASRIMFLSERSLQRALAREGSRGFRHELWSERMRRSEKLLRDGKTSSEVAALVGYKHPEHFARAFRRWSGSSPAEWLAAQTI